MIKSFSSKETEKIWHGEILKRISCQVQKIARRKLRMLNNSNNLNDLRNPPANRLKALKGNRTGQYSIRINDRWRICFNWEEGNCYNVEIVDYH